MQTLMQGRPIRGAALAAVALALVSSLAACLTGPGADPSPPQGAPRVIQVTSSVPARVIPTSSGDVVWLDEGDDTATP